MNEENKKSDSGTEDQRARSRIEQQKPRCGYWVVGGVVCWTRQQMIEAVAGMRDSLAGR
jgi:hypothetical protein